MRVIEWMSGWAIAIALSMVGVTAFKLISWFLSRPG
jgi:hypothetical protein